LRENKKMEKLTIRIPYAELHANGSMGEVADGLCNDFGDSPGIYEALTSAKYKRHGKGGYYLLSMDRETLEFFRNTTDDLARAFIYDGDPENAKSGRLLKKTVGRINILLKGAK